MPFCCPRWSKRGCTLAASRQDDADPPRDVRPDGLPPTPEEIDAFLKDDSADAYEKVVDRLLASPRYGRRWGRHWLDVAHYADTHGYDKDKRPTTPGRTATTSSAPSTRKAHKRFIQEQLAGDVLFPGEPDGVVATGFIVAGPWDFVGQVELREGTLEKEKTEFSTATTWSSMRSRPLTA